MKKSLILVILLLLLNPLKIQAESSDEIYTIDLSSLTDSYLISQIKSLSIEKMEGNNKLYINNKLANTSANSTFSFQMDGCSYIITADFEREIINIEYYLFEGQSIEYLVSLETVNGIHTLYIYPYQTENKTTIQLQGQIEGDSVVFPTAKVQRESNDSNISGILNLNDAVLTILIDQKEYSIDCKKETKSQYVFLEGHVERHLLSEEYMPVLEPGSFFEAKTRIYSEEEMDLAAGNEIVDLYSTKTGLSDTTVLKTIINYLKRIAVEDYIKTEQEKIKVLCNYDEDVCREFAGENKKYIVFGEDYYYNSPFETIKYDVTYDYDQPLWSQWMSEEDYLDNTLPKIAIESQKRSEYAYYSDWGDYQYTDQEVRENNYTEVNKQYRYKLGNYSDWSDYIYSEEEIKDCDDNEYCQWKAAVLYSEAIGSWSDYSDYVYDSNNLCADEDCRYTSKILYSKSIGKWGEFSDYIYEADSIEMKDCEDSKDCFYKSIQKYAISNGTLNGTYSDWMENCSNGNNYRCQRYYKYACRYLLSTKTVYSSQQYSSGSNGPCSGNYKVASVKEGYRKGYLKFDKPESYTLDSCTSTAGYTRCYSKSLYAIKTRKWTGYSDYIYDECLDTSDNSTGATTKCLSKRKYAYSYRNWSEYSPFTLLDCEESANRKCLQAKKYAIKNVQWSEYSQWENELPGSEFISYETRYRYRKRSLLGFGNEYQENSAYLGEKEYYRFSYPTSIIKEIPYMTYKKEKLGIIKEMDENKISELAEKVALGKLCSQIIDSYEGYLSQQQLSEITNKNTEEITRLKEEFLNQDIFLPYIYVTDHYRAEAVPFEVETYSASLSLNKKIEEIHKNSSAKIIKQTEKIVKRKDKVVYYDEIKPSGKLPSKYSDILKVNQKVIYKLSLSKKEIEEIIQRAEE